MLGTVFSFTAFLSTLISISGTPLHDRDIDVVLNLLQNRADKERSGDDTSSVSSSDDNVYNAVDQMNSKDIMNLIQQVVKVKNRVPNERYKFRNHYYQHEPSKNEKTNYGIKDRIWDQLFQEERKPLKTVVHKRLSPNRLLNPIKDDNRLEQKGGLNEYSKIFVILDPNALGNSGNPDELSSLISKILSQSSSTDEKSHQEGTKPRRYKGFIVKDSARRFRRDSKEMYGGGGGMGDMEDDYRPKRPRNDHGGGGGGGSGGRTAIPYIRHRGDIYERDH